MLLNRERASEIMVRENRRAVNQEKGVRPRFLQIKNWGLTPFFGRFAESPYLYPPEFNRKLPVTLPLHPRQIEEREATKWLSVPTIR